MGDSTVKRALLSLLVFIGACKNAHGQVPAIPDAQAAKLVPIAHKKWPPAPVGFIRIEWLGIDVQSPHEGAWEYATDIDSASISWAGEHGSCEQRLAVDTRESPDRRIVGTLPLTCHVDGEGCGSRCGEIRPIRGGPAEEPYSTESPAIEIQSAWSDRARDRSGLLVWRDGTVQFYGPECSGYRGRRGQLSVERVRALIDALERGGLLTHQVARRKERRDPMCEHAVTLLTIRAATRNNSIVSTCEPDELTRSALSLVDQVVGRNPCTIK
jgi:hypothetical protein